MEVALQMGIMEVKIKVKLNLKGGGFVMKKDKKFSCERLQVDCKSLCVEVKKLGGYSKLTNTVKLALCLLKVVLNIIKNGGEFFARDKDGKEEKITLIGL